MGLCLCVCVGAVVNIPVTTVTDSSSSEQTAATRLFDSFQTLPLLTASVSHNPFHAGYPPIHSGSAHVTCVHGALVKTAHLSSLDVMSCDGAII